MKYVLTLLWVIALILTCTWAGLQYYEVQQNALAVERERDYMALTLHIQKLRAKRLDPCVQEVPLDGQDRNATFNLARRSNPP